MSELKYKVGDKFLVEMEIIETVEGKKFPYRLNLGATVPNLSFDEYELDVFASNQPIQKPKVPQMLIDYYNEQRENYEKIKTLEEMLDWYWLPKEVSRWVYPLDDSLTKERQYAFLTLFIYGTNAAEVGEEKEKKYRVAIRRIETIEGFTMYLSAKKDVKHMFIDLSSSDLQQEFTKQELIDAGFGDVFDNPMFEVTEVE